MTEHLPFLLAATATVTFLAMTITMAMRPVRRAGGRAGRAGEQADGRTTDEHRSERMNARASLLLRSVRVLTGTPERLARLHLFT